MAVLIVTAVVLIIVLPSGDDIPAENEPVKAETIGERSLLYGIEVDTLLVENHTVRRNQFLSDILLRYNVDYAVIDRLARESKPLFDVRSIRSDYPYAIITTADSLREPLYFVYEESPTSYIVFSLADSIYAYRGEKEVISGLRSASGIINSSLWESLKDNGTDPNLANELSEIFAWTVDFFGIQKGDYFKILYEEQRVDGEVIGIGRVHSALLHHSGTTHYAFLFENGGNPDYFDEKGGSLRREFLKAPLRFKRISSHFSYSRYHPILKIRRPHTGIDYAASAGTPVYTVGDGVVIQKGWDSKGGGNFVKIRHNGTYTTLYMHLSGFARELKTGKHVKQGDLIGYVGSTGLATGPHLDFRFYRNGKPIDPLKVKSPPVEPVDSTYLETFIKVRDIWMDALDTVRMDEFGY